METKVVYPTEEEWDVLIILDACRYDYMKRLYHDYFEGKLEKRISPATCTPDWIRRVFTSYYPDYIYISANPFVSNSIHPLFSKSQWLNSQATFIAQNHFWKIVEAWRTGWDTRLGTVHPKDVNRAVVQAIKQNPRKKYIIHYMQPHYPYICYNGFKFRRRIENSIAWVIREQLIKKFGLEVGNAISRIVAPTEEESVARRVGVNGLRLAYELNIRIVLQHVAKLLEYLEGKIVITADHGELLGEEGKSGHPCGFRRLPCLTEIPWLEIVIEKKLRAEKPIQEIESLTEEDESLVRDRLEALGYI